jgi:hypothetical protein
LVLSAMNATMGAVMALPKVWPEKVKPTARAASRRGNQLVMVRLVVLFIGPSANPNRVRTTSNCAKPVTNPVSPHSTDHAVAAQT